MAPILLQLKIVFQATAVAIYIESHVHQKLVKRIQLEIGPDKKIV